MYDIIVNPINGKKVSIYSHSGLKILEKYKIQFNKLIKKMRWPQWFKKKIEFNDKIDPSIYEKNKIEFMHYEFSGKEKKLKNSLGELISFPTLNKQSQSIFNYFVGQDWKIINNFKKPSFYADKESFDDDEDYDKLGTGKGGAVCRNAIMEGYLTEAFSTDKIIGRIVTMEKRENRKRGKKKRREKIGFILFEKTKYPLTGEKALYLKLLCARSRKGVPVGSILIKEMEKYAKSYGYKLIFANALVEAFPWYIKNGWETVKPSVLDRFKKYFKNLFSREKKTNVVNKKENQDIPIIKRI